MSETVSIRSALEQLIDANASLRSQIATKDAEAIRYQNAIHELNGICTELRARAEKAEREVDRWKEREAESGAEADLQRRRADRLAAALREIEKLPCRDCIGDGHDEPWRCPIHETSHDALAEIEGVRK